jgi:hypothetical protein
MSCQKDDGKSEYTIFSSKLTSRTNTPSVINGMLHFDTYSDFSTFQNNLKQLELDTNELKSAYLYFGIDLNADSIPNLTDHPVCLKTESLLQGFESLRKIEEQAINQILNSGGDTFSIVSEPFFKTAINSNRSVHIGNRIYKFFDNGGVVIVINNDWTAYNEIKYANYENINQTLNVRTYKIQDIGEPSDSSVITSSKIIHDIKIKQIQSANGQYSIINESAIEISDGTIPIYRWEYPDNTYSIGLNPDRMLANVDLIKLKITNFNTDIVFAENIAGECIIAIGPNNIISKNNCSFDFNATFGDFSQSQWDVEWTFSDGTKNTNWVFSKQFSSSVTVTLCYINKISKVRCCGSKFLISTSCDCGIKKTRNVELIKEVNGQKWRIQASIWVKAGEVGCEMKYLRKFWVGWLAASNDGVVTDLSGTYKRQLADKSCLDVSAYGSKALGKGTYPTSISFTQSDIQNIFRESNKLTSGHKVNVKGTWFGFGINGVSRLILD